MMTTFVAVSRFKKTGPVFDTYDEIAQYKLIYGLASGVFIWIVAVIATFPASPLTFFAVPLVAWLTLRWLEDAISAARACLALVHLLRLGDARLAELRTVREGLHARVMLLATQIGLSEDPETYYLKADLKGKASKGQVKGAWGKSASYFSLRRRRKRDWNETMRWYDKVDYPEDDSMASI
jgi:glycerol-3-phosphate O-acyltransferase/dihydroxyacetone phosphate acyltransferase